MSISKNVTGNGSIVNWTLKLINESSTETCYNVKVKLTIPEGVFLTGPSNAGSAIINVNPGVFNFTTKTWHVGDMAPGAVLPQNFELTVDDISKAVNSVFTVNAELTSSCVEIIIADNADVLTIIALDECEQIELEVINSTKGPELCISNTPASSSRTASSSNVPHSSAMPSSSNPASSSNPVSSSTPPDSSSIVASSSVGQSSSNNGSSSAVASSSTAP